MVEGRSRSPDDDGAPVLRVVRTGGTSAARPKTDLGNAERLVDRFAGELRYCRPQRRWLYWDRRHWAADWTGEAERRAKATVRAIYADARMAGDPDERRALARWALASESRQRLVALLALAQTEAEVAVAPVDLDRDSFLLATNTGTIDLRTGQLRPADPADLITHLAPVDYDPEGSCPRWEAFLRRVVPDRAVRGFLQRAIGYSLTGSLAEQCLWILWGAGRNGKSTFLTTVQALLGDYAMQAAPSMLVDRRRDATPYDLADLPGRRLVAVAETEEVGHLAEGVIKQLTGGEPMRARNLYGDFFEFQPQAKIWLTTNHKPTVRGEDEGIWRRLHLVPFLERIADEELDRSLPRRLRQELPGILGWAVRGCLAWQHDGLAPPAAVVEATSAYRRDEGVLSRFLEDTCVISPRVSVTKKALYDAYSHWCNEQGLAPLSQPRLSKELKERGIADERGAKGVHYWRSLGLRSPDFETTAEEISPGHPQSRPPRGDVGDASDAAVRKSP